jgi:predicted nucleotidyltransferase component of viral defense system
VAVDELAADKMLALWGRAEARDLLDVDALLHFVTLRKMLDLAAEKDLGFDSNRLPDAITAATNRPNSAFSALGDC